MILGINGYIGSGKDTVGQMIQYHQYCNRYGYNKSDGFRQDNTGDYSISGWYIKKFAGKLKQIVSILTGISVSKLEQESVKSSNLGEEWDWIYDWLQLSDRKWVLVPTEVHPDMKNRSRKRTVREVLQLIGTEGVRNTIHQNAWVNALFTDYTLELGCKGGCEQAKDAGVVGHSCVDPKYCYNKKYPNWIITDTRFPNEAKAIKDRGGLVIRVNRVTWQDYELSQEVIGYKKNRHSSETSLDNYEFDYILDNSGTKEKLLEKVKIMMDDLKLWDSN